MLRVPNGTAMVISLGARLSELPKCMGYWCAGVLQVQKDIEDVVGVSCAALGRKLGRIVVPLLTPSLVAGWLFIFLIAAKELSMAILLAGPNSQMMAVVLFDQWSNGEPGELSAIGLVWTALMSVVAIVMYLCMKRSSPGMYGLK